MRVVICFLLLALSAACSRGSFPVVTADSNHFQLCENDTECPGGSYCQVGVCDSDCAACATACDARGRCGGESGAEPFVGSLGVSTARLELSLGQTTAPLTLQNLGSGTIGHFHVISDDPNVSVSPAKGSIPAGAPLKVTVAVTPGWSGTATLRTLSSAGVANTLVVAGSSLVGYLQGTVQIDAPFALGQADLAMDVHPDLSGVVDAAESLVWAARAPVTATDDGGVATFTFTLVAPPFQPANPSFGGELQRTVTLAGTHQGKGPVQGSYQEVITGLGNTPVVVSGTFQLAPSGPAHGLLPAVQAAFSPPVAPPALPPSSCLPGDSSCPAAVAARGPYYFGLAFPFEQWSWESTIANGECLITQSTAPEPCVNLLDELPAAEAFAHSSNPSQLWDVFRAIASAGQLQGKDILAHTLQPANAAYQGAQSDATQFAQAVALLNGGLHQSSGAGGLLTPANLWRAQSLTPLPSTLDAAANDAARFGGSVSAALFAAGQEIDRLRRVGQVPTVTQQIAQEAATTAFVDAAALATVDLDGTVQTAVGAGQLVDSAANFAAVASAFDQLRQGLNPAGYPADAIPFDYDVSQPSQDLFQQLYAHVTQNDLPMALSDETALQQDDRSFEQSQAALSSALLDVETQLQNEVTVLCGKGGACAGGTLAVDQANYQAALLAVQGAATASANAAEKMAMLQQQLQQESGDQTAEIQAITDDGQSLAEVAIAQARQQKQNLDWQCGTSTANAVNVIINGFGSALGGFLSGGPGGLLSGIASAANATGGAVVSAAMACEEDANLGSQIADAGQAALAENDEQIQIQQLQNLVQDNNLISAIFDAQVASQAALTEDQRQEQLANAALAQFQTDAAELQQDLANAQAAQNLQVQNADPTLRLYRDQAGMNWADAMQLLRVQAFLTTRAFEYMTNQSYSLEQQVFTLATAAALQQYLVVLDDAYQQSQMSVGWGQDFYDILSVRSDILGITADQVDPVTGQVLTPAEQFQAILNLPKNRDANGNLALQFNTNSAVGGVALFSPDVCEDRIADLKINVVSSSLSGSTGYVGLAEGGDTRLVDCGNPSTATSYALPQKTALIAAGLNLPRSAATDPTVPANTDLYERPVMASAWTLSIDLQDPRNAWVNLSQIDDFELWVHHTALTVQGN